MKSIKASRIVTMKDVKNYFHGNNWPIIEVNGNNFYAESKWNFQVEFTITSKNYKVEISSTEDSLDSEVVETSDPVKSIKEFLTKGMSQTSWERAASSPTEYASYLRRLSRTIINSKNPDIQKVKDLLRRFKYNVAFSRTSSIQDSDILKRLKNEGWKTESHGEEIKVNIGDGLYEATIKLESIKWNYVIEFMGHDELTESGTTDDPISTYDEWTKSPELAKAYRARKKRLAEPDADYDKPANTMMES